MSGSGRIQRGQLTSNLIVLWFKRFLDRGPEQRESKLTVLCLLIIIVLISDIIIYYIIIKLLIIENHPSRNQKQNLIVLFCFVFANKEPKTVLYPLITIILISYIIMKLLIKMRTIPAETGNGTPYFNCL